MTIRTKSQHNFTICGKKRQKYFDLTDFLENVFFFLLKNEVSYQQHCSCFIIPNLHSCFMENRNVCMEKLVFVFILTFNILLKPYFFHFKCLTFRRHFPSPLPLENLFRSSTFDERFTVHGS